MDPLNTVTPPQVEVPIPPSKPNYLPVMLSVLITALIVGGSVFFWLSSKIQKMDSDYKLQVSNLNNTVKQAQTDKDGLQQQLDTMKVDLADANKYKQQVLDNSKKNVCVDTDGGQDHYVNGTIKFQSYDSSGKLIATGDSSDDCVTTFINGENTLALREYYCDSNQQVQYDYFVCPNGCSKGVCLK